MENFFKTFRKIHLRSKEERRKHPRHDCFIEAHYMVKGRWYNGSIQDMSKGGAYIRFVQREKFSPGEDIFLVVQLRVLRDQIRGKITRVESHGIGVAFQTSESDYGESQAVLGDV
jgi:hypothetical protein